MLRPIGFGRARRAVGEYAPDTAVDPSSAPQSCPIRFAQPVQQYEMRGGFDTVQSIGIVGKDFDPADAVRLDGAAWAFEKRVVWGSDLSDRLQ
jgi:hypothetical protein